MWALRAGSTSFPALSVMPKMEIKPEVVRTVLPLSLLFVGMVTFNNLCLLYVEVSFYQVRKRVRDRQKESKKERERQKQKEKERE